MGRKGMKMEDLKIRENTKFYPFSIFLELTMTNYCPNHPFFLLKYEAMAALVSFENHPSLALSNAA